MRLLASLFLFLHAPYAFAQIAPLEIKRGIQGSSSIRAGYEVDFYITPFENAQIIDEEGYIPKMPSGYEKDPDPNLHEGYYIRDDNSTKAIWDFGDGEQATSFTARPNISYIYSKPGSYTVSVKLITDDGSVLGTASLDIEVEAFQAGVTYSALPTHSDSPTRLEFVASTFRRANYEGEVFNYFWDFGDGTQKEGEGLDQVQHTYAISDTYKTSLTVVSNYGVEEKTTRTITVVAANSQEITKTDDTLEPPDVIANQVNLKLSGTINGETNGLASSQGHLWFTMPDNDGACRVWINFWDDANLTGGLILINLGILPGELSNYTINSNIKFHIYAHTDAKNYRMNKSSLSPGVAINELGGPIHEYDEDIGLAMKNGTLELSLKNGDYLIGKLNAGFAGQIGDSRNPKTITAGVTGDITIDLSGSHAGDELGREIDRLKSYIPCVEQEFQETVRYPENGSKHLSMDRPVIRVDFSDDLKQESVSNDTFQVGYPDQNGSFVTVSGKFVNRESDIRFVPDQTLRKGIRYTIRVKTGESGVLSNTGNFIENRDGAAWQESHFWTELPFAQQGGEPSGLSCDVYQTVKNVPLISGKPAIMKIYADWPKYDDVADEAQYKTFDTKINLGNVIEQPLGERSHRFTRTDLRENWSNEKLLDDEAAIIPFIPAGIPRLTATVVVDTKQTGNSTNQFYVTCATPHWALAPELKVDVFALSDLSYDHDPSTGEYNDVSEQSATVIINRYTQAAKVFAEQLYPIKSITFSEPEFLPFTAGSKATLDILTGDGNISSIDDMVVKNLKGQSNADIILLVAPHEIYEGGGRTITRLSGGQGLMRMTAGEGMYLEKYAYGLVHEIGHVLGLDHKPTVGIYSRNELFALTGKHHYQGINGIRQSADGKRWWHKSSKLGNEQSENMIALMYPFTIPMDDAFILRGSYRSVQILLEDYLK